MPKVIRKRIKKPPVVKEGFKDKITRRSKTVLKYGASVFIVTVAAVAFLVSDRLSEKKAEKFGYEAYKIYYNEYETEFLNEEERYRKALDMFKKAYDTKRSPITLFYIADCYYRLGKYDDSLKTLKDFIKIYSGKDRLIPLVYQKMATVYIKKGDIDETMKTLDTLYNFSDIYKDFALMEHGRLLEKAGKLEEAKKKYRELIDKFPDSPFSDEAKAKL